MGLLATLCKPFLSARGEGVARERAAQLYVQAVAQSRTQELYTRFAVPDTVDGRFEMILLHVFLLIERLREEPASANRERYVRMLMELFVDDMDRSLREMGVGDTGVGKRVKHMAEALVGRMDAYATALRGSGLAEALDKNVYGRTETPASAEAFALADYLRETQAILRQRGAKGYDDPRAPVPLLMAPLPAQSAA